MLSCFLQVIRILYRFVLRVQRSAGITAIGVCVNDRHFLILRIYRTGIADIEIKLMFFHILTSLPIVSLHWRILCGII